MKIDHISSKFYQFALHLDSLKPGLVSEKWLDHDQLIELSQRRLTKSEEILLVNTIQKQVRDLKDERRSNYLLEMVGSIDYQLNLDDLHSDYAEFSKNTFGYKINRVSQEELKSIIDSISGLEKIIGRSRQEVYRDYSLTAAQLKKEFSKNIAFVKKLVPSDLLNYKDGGFSIQITSNKPWAAYNNHIAPFNSKLLLNKDSQLNDLDLHKLAAHEAYAGHHTELSLKDRLLVEHGYGEHGLVVTFSPQVFISEGIAEAMYVIWGIRDRDNNPARLMAWLYDRLIFALQNLTTFRYFSDHVDRVSLNKELSIYPISDQTRNNILNFSTDPLFGRYAPVYYSAYNFVDSLYNNTRDKEKFVNTLLTKPCTPTILLREFGA